MAREHARVYLTIWTDPDFRKLSSDAQWLYFVMLTHPTLTYCGVIEWREAKLAALAENMTILDLRQAAWELGETNLVAVDPDTEEALVRSFVRHDGVLKMPNVVKRMVLDYAGIASLKLMHLVSIETRRAIEEHPEYKGVEEAGPVAKQFPEPFPEGSFWVPDWFQKSSNFDTPKKREPFQVGYSPSPTPTPLSKDKLTPDSHADAFETFYEIYPRKMKPGDAKKAWKAAVKRADPEIIIAGARRLAADPNAPEPNFLPYPATWLRADSWNDEPYPQRELKPGQAKPISDREKRIKDWRSANGQPPIPQHLFDNPPVANAWGNAFLAAIGNGANDQQATAEANKQTGQQA